MINLHQPILTQTLRSWNEYWRTATRREHRAACAKICFDKDYIRITLMLAMRKSYKNHRNTSIQKGWQKNWLASNNPLVGIHSFPCAVAEIMNSRTLFVDVVEKGLSKSQLPKWRYGIRWEVLYLNFAAFVLKKGFGSNGPIRWVHVWQRPFRQIFEWGWWGQFRHTTLHHVISTSSRIASYQEWFSHRGELGRPPFLFLSLYAVGNDLKFFRRPPGPILALRS